MKAEFILVWLVVVVATYLVLPDGSLFAPDFDLFMSTNRFAGDTSMLSLDDLADAFWMGACSKIGVSLSLR